MSGIQGPQGQGFVSAWFTAPPNPQPVPGLLEPRSLPCGSQRLTEEEEARD